MNQKEFEQRTGQTVTAERFKEIEDIYMSAGDIDKDAFCEEWKEKKLDDSRVLAEVYDSLKQEQKRGSKNLAKELKKRGLRWNAEKGIIETLSYTDIKTFEDAMTVTGMTIDVNEDDLPVDVLAMMKLRIICAALNGLGEADVDNNVWPQFTEDEYRWYPWLVLYTQKEIDEMDEDERRCKELLLWGGAANYGAPCGLAYVYSRYAFSSAYARCGARLALKTEELSDYAGKQFTELWAQFYLGRDDFRRDVVE